MWIKYIVATLLLIGAVSCFPEGRVVNGTDSDITKHPYIVSLSGLSGSHSCGASIIAPSWILTAAHCMTISRPQNIRVRYGQTEISKQSPNVAFVKRIIIHENYRPLKNFANDIALLELSGQLIFNYRSIAPVKLPAAYFETAQVPEGEPGVLAGWGLTETGGVTPKILQEVHLKLYSDVECNSRHDKNITVHQICGGVDEGGKGQCSGDSGGPLLIKGNTQVGIVSWSVKPCTRYPYPGVYTKVSHYVDWIKRFVNV